MSFVQINWSPGPRELRSFGWSILIGFGLIGLVKGFWPFAWGVQPWPLFGYISCSVAVVVGGLGLIKSRAALPFYFVWMGLAFAVGSVMPRLVFGLVFFGLITPMGFCMRLIGRDPLHLRRDERDSYWEDISSVKDKSRYHRQF